MKKIQSTLFFIFICCSYISGQGEHTGYTYTACFNVSDKNGEPLKNAYIDKGGNDGRIVKISINNDGYFSFPMHTKKDNAIIYCEGYIPVSVTGKRGGNKQFILEELTDNTLIPIKVIPDADSFISNIKKIGNFYNTGLERYVKEKGTAIISYVINKKGQVADLKISGGSEKLRKEIMDACRHFPELTPFELYEKPVNVKSENDNIRIPSFN